MSCVYTLNMNRLFPRAFIAAIAWISWQAATPAWEDELSPAVDTFQIKFIENDWNTALSEAKAGGRRIFLDAYATWCGPCQKLKRTSFRDSATAAFFNRTYVNVAIDMEKGSGPELLKKYGIDSYPTLLILDEDGRELQRSVGFMNGKHLLQWGRNGIK